MNAAELLKELKTNADVGRLFMRDHLKLVHIESDGPLDTFEKAQMRRTTSQMKDMMIERLEKKAAPAAAPKPEPTPVAAPAAEAAAPAARRGGRRRAAEEPAAAAPAEAPAEQPERTPASVADPGIGAAMVKKLEGDLSKLGKIADEHSDTLANLGAQVGAMARDVSIIKAMLTEMWFLAEYPPFPDHVKDVLGKEVEGDADDPSVLLQLKADSGN